jgi:hypothetical protein
MSTPAPGRKLSTADLATTPEARKEIQQRIEQRPDIEQREAREALEQRENLERRAEAQQEARSIPITEGRRDDAGQPMPPRNRPTDDEEVSPLFADEACHTLWERWDHVQAGFVDEPRRAVQEADSLVAETMQQLANTFARERNNLEQQWGRGDNVSTEDLRIAFRRYRSFFKRLLSV